MKAIVYTEYGSPDVFQLKEVEKPTPQDNEVLVRVRAVAVNIGDLMARRFSQISPREFSMPGLFWVPARMEFGWNKPKKPILGNEFAGDVESVGKNVTQFKPGDAVICYRSARMGAYCEYVCMAEDGLIVHKPDNVSYEEAAALPYGGLTALSLLQKVNLQPGQKVLINGASGSIGSAALQIARDAGAEVTGVCSTQRIPMVKALGAHHVIDYTKQDFTALGETYDLVFDVLNKTPFARSQRVLSAKGVHLLVSFKMKQVLQMLWTSRFGDKKVICALSTESRENLLAVQKLIAQGKLKAIIDRCYPLEQTADAHRYVETGNRNASVVITIA